MSNGSETVANAVMTSLLSGVTLPTVPAIDLSAADYVVPDGSGPLYGEVAQLTNEDLTTRVIGGTGVFDAIMAGVKAHLQGEYDAGRIAGAEYTKAYMAITEAALSNATQFLLGRDQAYWQALTAQQAARTAQVQLITAKVQLQVAKYQLQSQQMEVLVNEANFALTKAKLASEDASYGAAQYQLINLLPQQLTLLQEQTEAQRAQTMDVRTDGTTAVVGLIGKQKALYTQQITSYQRDAEVKAAKLFTDAWITMKTIDEGLLPPTNFENTSLDAVLADIKTNNALG